MQSYRGILYYAVTRRTESFDDILWKHGILTRLKLCKDFLLLLGLFFRPDIKYSLSTSFQVVVVPSCWDWLTKGQDSNYSLLAESELKCGICRITGIQTQTITHALNCFMNSEAEWQRNWKDSRRSHCIIKVTIIQLQLWE